MNKRTRFNLGKNPYLVFEWPGVHVNQMLPPARTWREDFAIDASPLTKMGMVYTKGATYAFVVLREYEEGGAAFFRKVKDDPRPLRKKLHIVGEAADKIFVLGKTWNEKDLSALSYGRLMSLYQQIAQLNERLWRSGQPQNLLELHNSYLTSEVRRRLAKELGEKREQAVFLLLTTSRYVSLSEQQDWDFVQLVKKLRRFPRGSLANYPAVVKHWKRYKWMTYGWEGPALSLDYFVGNLTEGVRKQKILKAISYKLTELDRMRVEQEGYLKNLSKPTRALAELLLEILESKAKRIDAHSQTYFLLDRIFLELGRRKHLSLNQLRVIDPLKLKQTLVRPDPDQLNREYNLVVYWYEKGKRVLKFTGHEAGRLYKLLQASVPKVKISNEFKGELAYPGKVKGRVRVVALAKNVVDFKQGSILVTHISDPSYVPLMKKAAAIVTDVGGITSHAAIVSRELGIPCVIGTKIATRVFKDGDLVEVDANAGLVRKIK